MMQTLAVRKIDLYLFAFISGFVVLSLEMLAFRMLAPYFGSSVFVTGTVITIILTFFSLGYFIGGRLADQNLLKHPLYFIFMVSSIYLFIILFLFQTVLNMFSQFSTISGAVLSTFFLFVFPVTILSFVSPYLIKLHSATSGVGVSAGNIYAISTLGSILGSMLTTFLFIPFIGVQASLLLNVILLLGAGLRIKLSHFALLLVLSLGSIPALSYSVTFSDTKIIYFKESPYNTVFVVEIDGKKYLRMNQNRGMHSASLDSTYLTNLVIDDYLIAPLITKVKSLLILGGGAGTSAEQFNHFYKPEKIDIVEIDPEVPAVSKILGLELKNVRIFIEDGRRFLKTNKFQYDMIELDMFAGGIYIPYYVATKEFFEEVFRSLSSDGIAMMNVVDTETEFARAIADTLNAVFPTVYSMNQRTLIALKNPKIRLDERFKLHQPGKKIFTDDKCNLDWLIYRHIASQKGKPVVPG